MRQVTAGTSTAAEDQAAACSKAGWQASTEPRTVLAHHPSCPESVGVDARLSNHEEHAIAWLRAQRSCSVRQIAGCQMLVPLSYKMLVHPQDARRRAYDVYAAALTRKPPAKMASGGGPAHTGTWFIGKSDPRIQVRVHVHACADLVKVKRYISNRHSSRAGLCGFCCMPVNRPQTEPRLMGSQGASWHLG